MLSSEAVGAAFGRAATTYDQHADLQRQAAETLADLVPGTLPAGPAVDLGAGTAPLADVFRQRWPERRWLALDIAEPMLREARQRRRLDASFAPVVADFEALPLAPESLALVYSSFALQWSRDPAAVLNELASTLRPGGALALTVPVAGSLAELQASWAEVDSGVHVNALADTDTWSAALNGTGLNVHEWREQTLYRYYEDLGGIARMLKSTGAHRVDRAGETGLTGRRRFRQLVAAYERRRTDAGLPLTWQVLYLVARRGGAQ